MPEQTQVKILNVNDDEANRYALSRTLRRTGFTVLETGTACEALHLVRTDVTLVLLDVGLPDRSGFEVCTELKQDPTTTDIPIILVSAHYVETENRSQGLESGADAYLVYPIEPRELIATVRALLRVRQAEREARVLARQWQSTFDGLSDALCVLNHEGHVLHCNRAMADLLHQPVQQVVNQPYLPFLSRVLGAEVVKHWPLTSSSTPQTQECQHGERWLRISLDPIRDEKGCLTEWVHKISDITDYKQAQQIAQELKAREDKIQRLFEEMAQLEHLAQRLLPSSEGEVAVP